MRRLFILGTTLVLILALAAPAFAQGPIVHVVQRGENLFRIGLRYGVTVDTLAAANNLSNPRHIYAGQRLVIRRVHESAEEQPELMAYLEKHGLLPDVEVTIRQIMPFNETITLEHAGQTIVLGLAPAALIYACEV